MLLSRSRKLNWKSGGVESWNSASKWVQAAAVFDVSLHVSLILLLL